MSPADYKRLVAAGLDHDQIAVVMDVMERQIAAATVDLKEVEAQKRERARVRQREYRVRKKDAAESTPALRRVTSRHITSHNAEGPADSRGGATPASDARREDNLLNSESRESVPESQKFEFTAVPASEKIKPKSDGKRPTRLASDWTLPPDWRTDALKAGLPEHLIELEAAKMRDWSLSSPNGIGKDWRARWRNWVREAVSRQPAARAPPGRYDPLAGYHATKAMIAKDIIENGLIKTGNDDAGFGDEAGTGGHAVGELPRLIASNGTRHH